MKFIFLSYKDLRLYIRLKKTFLVLFYPEWYLNYVHKLSLYQLQGKISEELAIYGAKTNEFIMYIVTVDTQQDVENYVIDTLQVMELPLIVHYQDGSPNNFVKCINDTVKFDAIHRNDLIYALSSTLLVQNNMIQGDDCIRAIFDPDYFQNDEDDCMQIFIAGDKSGVGKSSICFALLASLFEIGVASNLMAYIKPATQCEAEQLVTQFCRRVNIENMGIGPVVFYQGFTRAYLAKQTDSSEEMLRAIKTTVQRMKLGKQQDNFHNSSQRISSRRLILIDGVGYPSVGSICNVSNAEVAKTLRSPVLLVGRAGVGDAVDAFNLNCVYFEHHGVRVLGGVFNKFELTGFYSLSSCRPAILSYFSQYRAQQIPYGFIPKLNEDEMKNNNKETTTKKLEHSSDAMDISAETQDFVRVFREHVDLARLLYDLYMTTIIQRSDKLKDRALKSSHNNTEKTVRQLDYMRSTIVQPLQETPVFVKHAYDTQNIAVKSQSRKRSREEVQTEARELGAKGG